MNRRRIVMFLIVTTLVMGLLPMTAHAGDAASSQRSNASTIADLLDRHNATRRSHGLSQLTFAPKVSLQVAQPWTLRMARSNNLAHNPEFGWQGASRWAENVAYTSSSQDAKHLMQMWLDSPGHRKNMLNPDYTVIAIGVAKRDGMTWATANFYAGGLRNAGSTYATGAKWLKSLTGSSASGDGYVYTTPGTHHVNGRQWRTTCVPYSQTKRCTTDIWATQVLHERGSFTSRSGWVFNNMTYLPSPRALWKTNNLGNNARWKADGRSWRTECDTAVTGRNGCRSYIYGQLVVATSTSGGYRYSVKNDWIFNNMVQFS